jgi:hypothetical protein
MAKQVRRVSPGGSGASGAAVGTSVDLRTGLVLSAAYGADGVVAALTLLPAITRQVEWTPPLPMPLFVALAGVGSGIAGAMLYLTVGVYLGGFVARIIGALALGFSMGLPMVIAEAACREHWLEVACTPNHRRTINLGTQAVTTDGNMISHQSNGRTHPSTTLTYRVDKGTIVCQDATTGRICRVLPGQTRIIDGAQVTVRSRNP